MPIQTEPGRRFFEPHTLSFSHIFLDRAGEESSPLSDQFQLVWLQLLQYAARGESRRKGSKEKSERRHGLRGGEKESGGEKRKESIRKGRGVTRRSAIGQVRTTVDDGECRSALGAAQRATESGCCIRF